MKAEALNSSASSEMLLRFVYLCSFCFGGLIGFCKSAQGTGASYWGQDRPKPAKAPNSIQGPQATGKAVVLAQSSEAMELNLPCVGRRV